MLRIATSQFPTSDDPLVNGQHMAAQTADAASNGAQLVHFPESCLSGYPGNDIDGFEGYDWPRLAEATARVVAAAREHRIWIAFGSAHQLANHPKPHNCLYIVDDQGTLIDRYDKRFCAGDMSGETGDLAHYTPGDHRTIWQIDGVRFGALICHEYRYPELYRDYARLGVQIMLHSFHSANIDAGRYAAMQADVGLENHEWNPATTIAGITQLSAMHAAAADNYMWISCANSSTPRSCWPSFVVRPDGVAVGQLICEQPGVLMTDIDPNQRFYDSTAAWRQRAMDGVLHSGKLVDDRRSKARQKF